MKIRNDGFAWFRIIGFTLLLSIPVKLHCQNLVPNPSFECGTDFCSFVQFRSDYGDCNWYLPTNGSTDKFSTTLANKACFSSMPDTGLNMDPKNVRPGSQLPRTGTKFSGIFTFIGPNPGPEVLQDYREYIEVQLSTPLEIGKRYCAEMYVSMAAGPRFAAGNIGMYFHDNPINVFNGLYLPFTPQVYQKEIISTTSWVRVSGTFIATTAVRYLTIGNFFDDAHTPSTDRKNLTLAGTNGYWAAYYFIDDVSVQLLPEKQFTFKGSQVICADETAAIEAGGGLEQITWTTLKDTTVSLSNSQVLTVTPQQTTRYRVKGLNCGLFVADTVTITVNPRPQVSIGQDTTLCEGDKLVLKAGNPGAKYQWQDGSVNQSFQVVAPGTYSVDVTNALNCTAGDKITISYKDVPVVRLGKDTILCDTFYTLEGGSKDQVYQWSNGAVTSSITPDAPGKYWVTARNQCGESADTIVIRKFDLVFVPNVITPNNDHINERFEIGDGTGLFGLQLLNRWGKEIYSTTSYNNDWPMHPDEVPSGVFYYYLSYEGCNISRRGWLRVIK